MCGMHYQRWRKHGDPGFEWTPPRMADRCGVADCEHRPNGLYCEMHAQRLRRHGDPLMKLALRGEPAPVRFWVKVDKDGPLSSYAPHLGPCWLWMASLNDGGYGTFHAGAGRHIVSAYRWAWEDANGPVPPGLTLDHLCRVRACVNPDHLEPVTRGENTMRGDTLSSRNAAKTHCPRGHAYDAANTYILPSRPTARYCRACQRDRRRK